MLAGSARPSRSSWWWARQWTNTSAQTPGPFHGRSGCSYRHLRAGQLVVLRSTVFPGVTRRVEQLIAPTHSEVDLAFCPERIAEGHAMTELFSLPQIVAARTVRARHRASALFGKLTDSIIELQPEEAELAKLFTNSWRYIKFAAANQFFMMANDLGLDFATIRQAMLQDYPRTADLPGCRIRGRALPVQGHHAVVVSHGGKLRARALRDARERRTARLSGETDGAGPRPACDDGRHSGDGIQGRERRQAVEPVLPAQTSACVPSKACVDHRSVCHRRPQPVGAGRGACRTPTSWSSGPRTSPTATWPSGSPWWTSGTSSVKGPPYDGSVRLCHHSGLPGGGRDCAGARPSGRRHLAGVRDPRGRRRLRPTPRLAPSVRTLVRTSAFASW